MDKLTAIDKPEQELNLKEIHTNAEKLTELFKKQLGHKNIETTLIRSEYYNHDDDKSIAYLLQYRLHFKKVDLPDYSLYIYSNAEMGNIVIPFLGHYGDTGAITIFHNQEINNILKVIMELTEAVHKEYMYDVQFNK